MTVGFLTAERSFGAKFDALCDCDAAVFIIREWSRINVKSELDGKSDVFIKMGEVSRKVKGVCFFSALTDTYGALRRSAIAFRGGKLCAIADALSYREKGFSPSFGVKSVSAGGYRFGIVVGDDILDQDVLKALSVTENDAIINLSPDIFEFDKEKLVSTLAYIYGMPIATVGSDKKVIASGSGGTLYSGKDDLYKCVLPIGKKFTEKYFKVKSQEIL